MMVPLSLPVESRESFLYLLAYLFTIHRPWGSMVPSRETHIKETLQILMDWAGCVNAIKINSVCIILDYSQPCMYNDIGN